MKRDGGVRRTQSAGTQHMTHKRHGAARSDDKSTQRSSVRRGVVV